MAEIFDKHGGYIAYKVHQLLKMLGADDEVAFVCPAEANVEKLVTHLGILLQNRQVTVSVPPRLLRRAEVRRALDGSHDEDWHRQLRHLKSQRFANVVLIDETAGDGTTVKGMVRLLRVFDLRPLAFVPVIDFVPGRKLDGVRIHPLYQIPNPRRGDV
jgi:hypothetical protein